MKHLLLRAGLFFTAVFFLTSVIPSVSLAAGVSPGTVEIEGLRPGTKTTRTVTFSRSSAEKPARLIVTIEGPAASSLSGPKEIEVSAGVNNVSYPLTADGGTLAAGRYEATVTGFFEEEKDKNSNVGMGSTIVTAAMATVRLIVTNETKQEFAIKQVIINPTEVEQPLGFTYLLENTGNVDARPSKITISVVDQKDPSFTYNETFLGDSLMPVKAFSTEEGSLLTKARLPIGKYWASFVFFNEKDEAIFTREKYPLQVFPAGTLAQKGSLEAFGPDKQEYEQNELVIFSGTFKNTGEVGVQGTLLVDISLDGKRVDLLTSEQVFVPAGRSADFSLTTRLTKGGAYTVKGRAKYGINETEEITATVTVKGFSPLLLGGVIGAVTILIALALVLMRKKKKKSFGEAVTQ